MIDSLWPGADGGSIDIGSGFGKPAGADSWHWSWDFTARAAITAIDELHRAIVALDLDPEITMPPTPTLSRLTHGMEELTGRTANGVGALIAAIVDGPHAAFLQRAREEEGTGTLGLYMEAVSFDAANAPFSHMRFFVVGAHLWAYNRAVGDTRAAWRHRGTEHLAESLSIVQAAIDKPTVKVFGHPVLVELTAADISAVEEGTAPSCRFRGQSRIERDFGRYDFAMPVVTVAVPDEIVAVLRSSEFVTTTDPF